MDKPILRQSPKVNGFHETDTWSRSFKVMYNKKEHKRSLLSLSYSLRVMLDLDKFHACMEIWQISMTKWTPVHEQNKVARKPCLRLATAHGTCGFANGVPWIVIHLTHTICLHKKKFASIIGKDKINKAKQAGGRIVCVGTTSCRTIESAADENGVLKPGQGDTDIFIYPGYSFKMMDVLITNFHLPESTLLMLVSALAGKEQVMRVYEEAVQELSLIHISEPTRPY